MAKKTETKETEKINPYYQHGDVMFEKLEKKPAKSELKEILGNVVESSPVSGHSHYIAEGTTKILFKEATNEKFVEAKTNWTISHQEHAPINMPAGFYKVDYLKEYDPFEKAVRRLKD